MSPGGARFAIDPAWGAIARFGAMLVVGSRHRLVAPDDLRCVLPVPA
jgi:hypothetical protein